MALTPSGFPENHPSSIKKERALLEARVASAEIVMVRENFSAACRGIVSSCTFAARSVHSRLGATYRSIGQTLGF